MIAAPLLLLAVAARAASPAPKPPPRLEYRLVALPGKPGEEFHWADGGDAVSLERTPFLTIAALRSVHVEHNPRRQFYEVRWKHADADVKALETEADRSRTRDYCILLDRELQECRKFPRRPKEFDADSESISYFYSKRTQETTEAQASALAGRLRSSLVK